MQPATIDKIRADIPALAQYVWFQNGGVSVTPRAIAAEQARLMEELVARGPMHIVYPDEEYPRRARSKAALARFFGVAPSELALMRGVSEAFQTVLRGLDWQHGDQLLITAEEEAALHLPSLHLRDRHGVEVVKVPLLADPEEQLDAFAARFTERTRLLAVSHVTTETGFRIPVEQLCRLAPYLRRLAHSAGLFPIDAASFAGTFVDLAHSAGLFPIDLAELNCDFAGILSYKWMYAPYAAGALYVHPNRLEALQLTYAGGRAEAWLRYDTDTYALKEGAERFEYGPWSWPLMHTWAFAAGYLTDIGLNSIWERTAQLTRRLKQALRAIPGVTLYTPLQAEHSAALVAFSIANWDGEELTRATTRALAEADHRPSAHHRPQRCARQRSILFAGGRDRPARGSRAPPGREPPLAGPRCVFPILWTNLGLEWGVHPE